MEIDRTTEENLFFSHSLSSFRYQILKWILMLIERSQDCRINYQWTFISSGEKGCGGSSACRRICSLFWVVIWGRFEWCLMDCDSNYVTICELITSQRRFYGSTRSASIKVARVHYVTLLMKSTPDLVASSMETCCFAGDFISPELQRLSSVMKPQKNFSRILHATFVPLTTLM